MTGLLTTAHGRQCESLASEKLATAVLMSDSSEWLLRQVG